MTTHNSEILETIINNLPDSVVVTDISGEIRFANQTASKQFGYSLEKILNVKIDSLVPLDNIDNSEERKKQLLEEGVLQTESVYIKENGSLTPIEITRKIIEHKNKEAILTTIKEIAKPESIFREIVEQSQDPIIITDLEGKVEYVNSAFVAHTGYQPDQIYGENLRILKSGKHDETFYYQMWTQIGKGESWCDLICNISREGEIIFDDTVIFPIKDPNGNTKCYCSVRRDASERVKLEIAKAEVEKMMIHDIRSPVGGIVSLARMLLDEDPKCSSIEYAAEIKGCLEEIGRTGNSVLDIIQTYMNSSNIESGRYKLNLNNVSLDEILSDIVNSKTGHSLSGNLINLQVSEDVQEVRYLGDRSLLFPLFSNLITNAIEASPLGQRINITLDQILKDQKDFYRIQIQNSGAIPEEIRDSFFNKYTTSGKKHGTGLGTHTAKLYTKAHQGYISFKTSNSEGTTLCVLLPKEINANR